MEDHAKNGKIGKEKKKISPLLSPQISVKIAQHYIFLVFYKKETKREKESARVSEQERNRYHIEASVILTCVTCS